MAENNLKFSDLPQEIADKLVALNLLISDYQSNPTDALKNKIELKSAKIGHDILDHLENSLPDEDEQGQSVSSQTPPSNQADNNVDTPKKKSSGGLLDWFFN
jgi:hypothetical protein